MLLLLKLIYRFRPCRVLADAVGVFVCHAASSSLVLPIGGLNRDCAHRNASAHRYKGRQPKR
jgi:hypothetical protein